MAKKYRLRPQEHEDLLTDLLAARGVGSAEREVFLLPDFERDSHDPFLLPDMDKAVERIFSALKTGEKVAVWSDYDADGLPGGVMLAQFLREMGLSVVRYVPHRHLEGYGLNEEGIAELASKGVTLMLTVDCGTTDHAAINFAKQKGIDTIVTDHHVVQTLDTPAFALLNPHRPDSTYPFSGLCGAGVAWKLVQALIKKNEMTGRPFDYAPGKEKWMLDLVGIGTLSDMVPLRGENRMLAHFGLKVLRRGRRPGLAALLQLLKIKPAALTEDDIGFMVSPRLNAASRMGNPHVAARLLAAEEGVEAVMLARELQALNDERKTLVANTVKDANKRLKEIGTESPIIVMGNPNWRPGILGLVASSLVEAHQKPVFLWGRNGSTESPEGGGEEIKGSCRSEGTTNVVEVMKQAGDALGHFGGHFGAGGFSLSQEKVHSLHAQLERAYKSLNFKDAGEVEVVVDRHLELSEVSHAQKAVEQLAPFGVEHQKPLFILPNVTMAAVRPFGKTKNHLGVTFSKNDRRVDGMAFFSGADSFQKPVAAGTKADVVGHVELDWQGAPRIRIVDIL